MSQKDLESLRSQIDYLNLEILRLINERAAVVDEIGAIKEKQGVNRYDPLRERHMLDLIKENNNGPLNQMTVDYIFKQIFKTALKQLDSGNPGGCSAVAKTLDNGDTIVGRNMDFYVSNKPAFIVRTKEKGKYETVGIAYYDQFVPNADVVEKRGVPKVIYSMLPMFCQDVMALLIQLETKAEFMK